MTYAFTIKRPVGTALQLTATTGRSIIILGSNGSGKTRLGVEIENQLSGKLKSVRRFSDNERP